MANTRAPKRPSGSAGTGDRRRPPESETKSTLRADVRVVRVTRRRGSKGIHTRRQEVHDGELIERIAKLVEERAPELEKERDAREAEAARRRGKLQKGEGGKLKMVHPRLDYPLRLRMDSDEWFEVWGVGSRALANRRSPKDDEDKGADEQQVIPGGSIDAEPLPLLGPSLRATRNAAGVSQEALAARTSGNHAHISRAESGQRVPAEEKMVEWLDALDVEPDERESLLVLRHATELERCGLSRGLAMLAALIQRGHTDAAELRRVLEHLADDERTALAEAFGESTSS